jgi:hypothetical protein
MVMVHYVIEGLLVLLLFKTSYTNIKLVNASNSLANLNQDFINQYEIIYTQIVELEEELKVVKQARDLYWEDRNSLIDNIKIMNKGNNDKPFNM